MIAVAAAVAIITTLSISLYSAQSQAQEDDLENDVSLKNNDAKLAASIVEGRIEESIRVMRLTGELAAVKGTEYAGSISTDQMGIPEDQDVDKRMVARQVLSEHREFGSIFFLMLNGDIYIGEPFDQQEQLPRLNYADRDWYKGVRATGDAYVSSVFMSAAIHEPAIAVAVPVRDDSQVVVGYWVAIVNLASLKSDLGQLDLGDSATRVLIVDHNGTGVADTKAASQAELKSFIHLDSVRNALSGQAGTEFEQVDGVEMIANYAPIKAHPHTWGLVFLQPAGNAGLPGAAALYTSPHVRVDIIISTARPDGTTVGEEMLRDIQTELALEFGGVTRYPPFNGSSLNDDGAVHDGINNAGFFVVAQNTPENVEWFATYKETLEGRLGVDGIFMTMSPSAIMG